MNVSHIGHLHIESDKMESRFEVVKAALQLDEILFLSTCNRVEFMILGREEVSAAFVERFFSLLYPEMPEESVSLFAEKAAIKNGREAVGHVFRVASSIDSLVIGEREIITQVRQSYEMCSKLGLAGDFMRLLIGQTIRTAKQVYTETKISQKPVSIVSIAYQRLQGMDIPADARVLVVGAGVTNTAMCRFLKKHGMTEFVIFNRTLSKAEELAAELNGKAFPLSALPAYDKGFDVLVTCTGSEDVIITDELYGKLLIGDISPKVTIDLALPNDIAESVHTSYPTRQISINVLQTISDNHLQERSQEIVHAEAIIEEAIVNFELAARERAVEIAMRPVPQMVKEIRNTAFNNVFKNEIDNLDAGSLEVLEKIVGYIEKKYMSMPMKMAKEILTKS